MKKYKRILLIVIGIIIIILIIISLYANSILKNKIEAFLQNNIPDHIENSYESISVNVIGGTVSVIKPSILIKIKDSTIVHTQVDMESFVVEGLSYWDYLFNDEIHIDKLLFEDLKFTYYKDRNTKTKDTIEKKTLKLPKPIVIDNINFESAVITIIDKTKDSIFLYSNNINVYLEDLLLNENTLVHKIPVKFGSAFVSSDSIFFKAGNYEYLNVDRFKVESGSVVLNGIQYKTKYSREQLSQIIRIERDHINVEVDEFKINNFDVGFVDDTLSLSSNFISIDHPNASLYRDKLVTDDPRIKKLYSKMIRELPFKLTLDSISIINGKVVYSEKAIQKNPAGVLTISNLNAGVSNLSNTYLSPEKTSIIADAIFMKNTPIRANWYFDINDTNDAFIFTGNGGKLDASDMNIFITPLLNTELKGQIHNTYFTISGDQYRSTIELKQSFDHIKVDLLTKKKNKKILLSSMANIIVHRDSKAKDEEFNTVSANATRDNTKSFFNYLARNIKSAMIVNFTQKKNKKPKKRKEKISK
jgi:hypothetical protein